MTPRILIIGAGPAGSLAAILLARAGLTPTVVEAKPFPREKVCGECLSPLGVATLRAQGLSSRFPDPHLLTHTALIDASGRAATLPLPAPMCGLTRNILDSRLLQTAVDFGARVLHPVRVESFSTPSAADGPFSVRLRTRDTQSDAPFDLILDGSGKPEHDSGSSPDIGIKAHFTAVALDSQTIHLFAVPTGYIGVAAVGGGVWNLAYAIKSRTLKAHGSSLDRLFEYLVSQNSALKEAVRNATAVTPWLTSGLPRHGLPGSISPRFIPMGNAAAALDPIGGQGMGLALASAALAAETIIESTQTGSPPDTHKLLASYRALWRRRRPACRALAMLMSTPASARVTTALARGIPVLSRAALQLITPATP